MKVIDVDDFAAIVFKLFGYVKSFQEHSANVVWVIP